MGGPIESGLRSFYCILKNVFLELKKIHRNGFTNWYSKVLQLAEDYEIDILEEKYSESMKRIIRNKIEKSFVQNWCTKVQNVEMNTSLRTYTLIKNNFGTENYLSLIKKNRNI